MSTLSWLRRLYSSSSRNSSNGNAAALPAAASRIVSSSRSAVCARDSKRRPAAAAGRRMIWPISRRVGGSRSNCPSPSLSDMRIGRSVNLGYRSLRIVATIQMQPVRASALSAAEKHSRCR